MSLGIKQDILRLEVSINNVLLMQMLNRQTQLCYVKLGLLFGEGHLPGKMEAEISAGAVIECEVQVMWGLEGEVQVDDEDVVGLFEDVCLDDSVFQLFLQDQVFLLEGFEGIETAVNVELGQEDLAECTRAESIEDRKGRKVDLVCCNFVEFSC